MSLRDIYQDYNNKVQFILVYTSEAYPTDGWYMGDHEIRNHQSMDERREVARMCEVALKYGIKTSVDEMDDAVSKAYVSLPDRLYLVGLNGRSALPGISMFLAVWKGKQPETIKNPDTIRYFLTCYLLNSKFSTDSI